MWSGTSLGFFFWNFARPDHLSVTRFSFGEEKSLAKPPTQTLQTNGFVVSIQKLLIRSALPPIMKKSDMITFSCMYPFEQVFCFIYLLQNIGPRPTCKQARDTRPGDAWLRKIQMSWGLGFDRQLRRGRVRFSSPFTSNHFSAWDQRPCLLGHCFFNRFPFFCWSSWRAFDLTYLEQAPKAGLFMPRPVASCWVNGKTVQPQISECFRSFLVTSFRKPEIPKRFCPVNQKHIRFASSFVLVSEERGGGRVVNRQKESSN